MAWQDRDYNRGGAGDYLVNLSGILGLSVPFGTWFGVRVRLHFWLLLAFIFVLADLFRGASFPIVVLDLALMLVTLLLHEFGHRAFTGWVGGEHNDFMLWPAGGMVFPTVPPGPWARFVAYVGGIAVNFTLGLGGFALYHLLSIHGDWLRIPFRNPLMSLGAMPLVTAYEPGQLLLILVINFTLLNWGLVLVNLLPYFWFDGGFLWQSVLTPLVGARSALNITCIFAMILAVPMFALALVGQNLLLLFVWAFLFSSAYTARTQMMPETDEYAVAIGGSSGVAGRLKSGRWSKTPSPRAQARQKREDDKIDAILAKVSAHGMHSLTWFEKRTLKRGSKRLR